MILPGQSTPPYLASPAAKTPLMLCLLLVFAKYHPLIPTSSSIWTDPLGRRSSYSQDRTRRGTLRSAWNHETRKLLHLLVQQRRHHSEWFNRLDWTKQKLQCQQYSDPHRLAIALYNYAITDLWYHSCHRQPERFGSLTIAKYWEGKEMNDKKAKEATIAPKDEQRRPMTIEAAWTTIKRSIKDEQLQHQWIAATYAGRSRKWDKEEITNRLGQVLLACLSTGYHCAFQKYLNCLEPSINLKCPLCKEDVHTL